MARQNNTNYGNRRNNNDNKRGRKPKYSDLERLAFDMGKVQAGLSKDTLVKDSYEAGKAAVAQGAKKKKPLC